MPSKKIRILNHDIRLYKLLSVFMMAVIAMSFLVVINLKNQVNSLSAEKQKIQFVYITDSTYPIGFSIGPSTNQTEILSHLSNSTRCGGQISVTSCLPVGDRNFCYLSYHVTSQSVGG